MANTEHRGYPLPDDTRNVREEILSLQQLVLPMLDDDIHALFSAISGLALTNHTHDISGVSGLADALAGKMAADTTFALSDLADVVGSDEAPDGYILVKSGASFVAQAAVSALGNDLLFKASNLGDLANKDAARNNLKAMGYEVATVTDADALFQPGNYIAGTSWTGSPVGGVSGENQGYLAVQRLGTSADVLQVHTASAGTLKISTRRRIAGVWGVWRPMVVGAVTISAAAPAGGTDGDVWYQVDA